VPSLSPAWQATVRGLDTRLEPGSWRPITFDDRAAEGREDVIGNLVGTYNDDLAALLVLAQTDRVTLHTRAYPLTEAVEALTDLDAGRVRGRAILVP
jgi:D-arabinose 1-dehydrogenase-like Zn-dependent alcohol dehydrogenase